MANDGHLFVPIAAKRLSPGIDEDDWNANAWNSSRVNIHEHCAVSALVNKLVLCAKLSLGASEVWRLRLQCVVPIREAENRLP